jgi:hypothetical protein
VPLVSPPTSPTSSAGHAPCGRFGIEELLVEIAVFGGKDEVCLGSCELVKKSRSLKMALQISQMKNSTSD